MNGNHTFLTDIQLYELSQNKQLNKEFRQMAQSELSNRNLSLSQLEELQLKYESRRKNAAKKLAFHWKLLLFFFPFIIVIHSIIAAYLLDRGEEMKWKQYWFCISFGFMFYTIVVFLFAKNPVN